jgi:hypothetical protein
MILRKPRGARRLHANNVPMPPDLPPKKWCDLRVGPATGKEQTAVR